MIYKTLFLSFLITNSLFASFQEVRIGKIDKYYEDKISYEQLRKIIDEIEDTFEYQLNINIFDYSQNGKDIDILYVPASKLERRITKKIIKLEKKREKIKKYEEFFYTKIEEIDILKSELEYKNTLVNNKVEDFNKYVLEINNKKTITKEQYDKSLDYINNEKESIALEIKDLNNDKKALDRKLRTYNQKNLLYKSLIREHNRLSTEIESMNRNFKKVKGRTFGTKETTLNTFYENGEKIQKETVKHSMNKIEIYGFENLGELKAILAHEIAHLVGIAHINSKDSLMHPILQEKQVKNLFLTNDDILNFQEGF